MQGIALDFDGVLCDSQHECFQVALNVFGENLSTTGIDLFFEENKEIIYSYRPYVISGEDYYFIIKAVYEGLKFSTQSEFLEFKQKNISQKNEIKKKFYDARKSLMNENINYWISLNPLYKSISEKIEALINDFEVFIVTTKDFESVKNILIQNKIEINTSNIFSKENSLTKHNCLKKIINEKKLKYLPFIDDQIINLLSINVSEVELFLAKWGYNNQTQVQLAVKSKIKTIELEEFPRTIFKNL